MRSRQMFLMQGIPASGKSTMAKMIADKYEAIIFSTDDYWINAEGVYEFDEALLGQAHLWNQRRCATEMISQDGGNIIIDNTNIKNRDAKAYLILARMYGYSIRVIRTQIPYAECVYLNSLRSEDRKISEYVMHQMYQKMEDIDIDLESNS